MPDQKSASAQHADAEAASLDQSGDRHACSLYAVHSRKMARGIVACAALILRIYPDAEINGKVELKGLSVRGKNTV